MATLLLSSGLLVGCDSTKEQLGMTKKQPDAFVVYSRAPLSMPPADYFDLPQPGQAPRVTSAVSPAQSATVQDAKRALAGNAAPTTPAASKANDVTRVEVSAAEQAIKAKAKTSQARPDIRDMIDEETRARQDDGSWLDTLDFLNSRQKSEQLDAGAERKRLQQQQTGQQTGQQPPAAAKP
jgi:hypothetical protein